MGAPSKRARKTRTAAEFDIAALMRSIQPPPGASGVYSWSLREIVNARNAQMAGQFALAARLAESMRTDDALFVAHANRLAPLRSIKVALVPAKGSGGAKIADEAEALFGQTGVGVSPDTMRDIHGCLVNHSVAFAIAVPTPRPDGSRVDYTLTYWPIEYVRWDAVRRSFKTVVYGQPEEFITHGDGRWVVFQEGEYEPFKNASLLAAAMVWARHAFAIRDWSKSSVAHGSAKVIGEMPAGVALQKADPEGNPVPTDEAAAMVELLRAIASSDAPVGLIPAGAKTNFLTNNSTAWQIFTELVLNAERSAARIYLGTDGTLGATGGAPGVDITALFGVATTKIQGDASCIERALQTGLIEVWTAVNFGDSKLAPYRRYMLPDSDADAERTSLEQRRAAFFADIKAAHDNAFDVTQDYVDSLAESYGIEAPSLPSEATKAPTIMLAPTDFAAVVSVNEARASGGLGTLKLRDGTEDPDGFLTVAEFEAKIEAAAVSTEPSVGPGGVGPTPPPPYPEVAKQIAAMARAHEEQNVAAMTLARALASDSAAQFASLAAQTAACFERISAEKTALEAAVVQLSSRVAHREAVDAEETAAIKASIQDLRTKPPTPPTPAERQREFRADIETHRVSGFELEQADVQRLADLHGVPAPRLRAVI